MIFHIIINDYRKEQTVRHLHRKCSCACLIVNLRSCRSAKVSLIVNGAMLDRELSDGIQLVLIIIYKLKCDRLGLRCLGSISIKMSIRRHIYLYTYLCIYVFIKLVHLLLKMLRRKLKRWSHFPLVSRSLTQGYGSIRKYDRSVKLSKCFIAISYIAINICSLISLKKCILVIGSITFFDS
jgi:hypothetical protein